MECLVRDSAILTPENSTYKCCNANQFAVLNFQSTAVNLTAGLAFLSFRIFPFLGIFRPASVPGRSWQPDTF